jgi:hypothetical protein
MIKMFVGTVNRMMKCKNDSQDWYLQAHRALLHCQYLRVNILGVNTKPIGAKYLPLNPL